jgi:diguanylate cyclase (GGDEF)-like protein
VTTAGNRQSPWRFLRRLGSISPHRQVQLLLAISVAIVGVMVATVLGLLDPTVSSLHRSNGRLVPAIEQLDAARDAYRASGDALRVAIASDVAKRGVATTQAASLNTTAEVAWNKFQRVSSRLPGELALQRTFEADLKLALVEGSALFSAPAPSATAVAQLAQRSEAMQQDLIRVKELYEVQVQRALADASDQLNATREVIIVVSAAALLLLFAAFAAAARSAQSREQRLRELDRTLVRDAEQNELEARLQRSLEMAHTEAAVYPVVGRALTLGTPGLPAELLVADSSRAHFRQVMGSDAAGDPGCPVMSPADCPAATWGQTQIWTSSTALDACPHLQGRPSGDCAAMCVPVSIGGKTIGVVHATAPDSHPPGETVVAKVELIARKTGERIGMLRAFTRSETQAHTDPLTGLMNRRSLEFEIRDLSDDGRTYVAAYGDLDHFKQLNDVYGHDAGDQALRLFARVLRDAVRPNDLTARYGGEEFVVVLPDCTVEDAFIVVDRIRERLVLAQVSASGPHFTASFGIAVSRPEQTFSQTLEIADAALLRAKAAGRDRVLIAGPDDPSAGDQSTGDQSTGDQSTGISSEPVSSDAPTISSTRS